MTNRRQPPGFETYRPGSDGGPPRGPQGRAPQGGPRAGPPRRRPGPARQPQRKRSGGFGTLLLYLAVGFAALLGAGIAVLALAPPTDFIRDQLVAQVKANTGRDLRISGKTGLSFYPALGFSMDGVRLSPPPGMDGEPFVRMKSMTVQVKLLPLLSRKVAVERFVLEEPVFDLRVDRSGRKSWDFAAASLDGSQRRIQLAQASTGRTSDAGSPGGGGTNLAALEELELGDVRILNGALTYSDEQKGSRERVDAIDVTLGLTSIADPFRANGNLSYKSERIDFDAVLTSLKSILRNEPANLNATFKSAHLNGSYDGRIDVSGDLKLDGDVDVQSGSVRSLAKWFGTDLPPARGFGPFSLKGALNAANSTYTLSQLNLGLDGATGTGKLAVATAGERPKVTGDLRLSELDLNNYLSSDGASSNGGSGSTSPQPARQQPGAAPGSIEDLIDQSGATRVRGYTQRSGWSTDPIDVSALGAVDADLDLTIGRLIYERIQVGRTQADVGLTNRLMTVKLNEMQLYEGTGKGVLSVDGRQGAPAIGANFNLNDVSARPFLRDAAEIDRIDGRGQVLIAVTASGGSQQDLVSGLNGKASIAFKDGAIVGVNVPRAVRAFQQGQFADIAGGDGSEKTDFSELTASFTITNGIARNDDLLMLSPLLRVTGSGQVLLPPRQVDYTVTPKLVASLSGQGGQTGLSGVEIPVKISGPFENLSYTPDLDGILSDPNKAVDAVRSIGEQIGGEKAGEAIDKVLGGGKAKQILDGLFGGR